MEDIYIDNYVIEPPDHEEPTASDYCQMEGHPMVEEWGRDFGGNAYCYCGKVIFLPYDEPHDEYSRACSDLADAYVEHIKKYWNFDMGSYIAPKAVHENHSRVIRYELGKSIFGNDVRALTLLLESARNSSSSTLSSSHQFAENKCIQSIVLGSHVDPYGEQLICLSFNPSSYYFLEQLQEIISDSKRLPIARIMAALYNTTIHSDNLNTENDESVQMYYQIAEFIMENPDKLNDAFSICRKLGVSKQSAALVQSLNDEASQSVSSAFVDGLI